MQCCVQCTVYVQCVHIDMLEVESIASNGVPFAGDYQVWQLAYYACVYLHNRSFVNPHSSLGFLS